jgi:hypothetical protein
MKKLNCTTFALCLVVLLFGCGLNNTPAFGTGSPVEANTEGPAAIDENGAIVCEAGKLSGMPDRLHMKLFNASVNVGVRQGAKLLQQSINAIPGAAYKVKVDGALGPLTRNALCGMNEQSVINEYKNKQAAFYRSIVARKPGQAKFLKGWLRRAAYEPPQMEGVQ